MIAGIWEELVELYSTLTLFLLLSLGFYVSCEESADGPLSDQQHLPYIMLKRSPIPSFSGMAFPVHVVGRYMHLYSALLKCCRKMEMVDEGMRLESLFGKCGCVLQGLTTEAEFLV